MSRRRSVTALNVEDVLQNSPTRQPPRHSISKYRTEGHHAVCPDPFAVATSSHSRRKVTWPENQRLAAPEGEDARLKAVVSDYEECSQKWRTVPVTHQKASETVSRSRGTQNYVRLHNNIEKMQSEVQNFYEEQLRRAIEANPHVISRLRHAQHAGTMPDADDAALCDEQQAHLDEVITSIYQLRQSSMRFMSMFLNDEEKRHLGGRLHYMFGDDAEDEKIPAHRRYVPQRVLDATLNQREMEAMAAAAAAEAAAVERNNNRSHTTTSTITNSGSGNVGGGVSTGVGSKGHNRGDATPQARTTSQPQSNNSSQHRVASAHPRSVKGAKSEVDWEGEEVDAAVAAEAKAYLEEEARRKKDKRDKKERKERKREVAALRQAVADENEEDAMYNNNNQQQHSVSTTPVDQGLYANGASGDASRKRSSLKSANSHVGGNDGNYNNGGMREKDVARIPSSIASQQQRLGATSPSRSAVSTNGGDADVAEFASIDDVPLPWAVSVRHDSSASPSRASSRESSPRKHHQKSPGKHHSGSNSIKKGSNASMKKNTTDENNINGGTGSSSKSGGSASRKGSHHSGTGAGTTTTTTHEDPSANVQSSSNDNTNAQSEDLVASGTQRQHTSTSTSATATTTTTTSKATSKRGRLPGTLHKVDGGDDDDGNNNSNLQDAATGEDACADVADASTETPRRHEHDQQDLYEEVHSGQLCLSPITKQQKEKEDAAANAERMRAMIHEELERDRRAREEAERERIQFVADEAAVVAQVAAEQAEGRFREEAAKRAALEEQLRQVEAERDAARAASIDRSPTTATMEGAADDAEVDNINNTTNTKSMMQGSMSSVHSDDSDFTKELKKRNQKKRSGLDQKAKREGQTRSSISPDPLNATTALSIECVDGVERVDVGPKPVRLSRLKLQEGEFHRHGCKPTYKLGMAPVDGSHHHKREYHHSASAQPSPRRALTPRQHTILGIDLPLQFTTRARSIPPPKFISPAVSPKKSNLDEKKKKSTTDKKKDTTAGKKSDATHAAVEHRTTSGTRRRVRADSTKKKREGGASAGAPI